MTEYGPPIDYVHGKTNSQVLQLTHTPITVDEDIICSAWNQAIAKYPTEFYDMLDCGSVGHKAARRIVNELSLMGYCITEKPF